MDSKSFPGGGNSSDEPQGEETTALTKSEMFSLLIFYSHLELHVITCKMVNGWAFCAFSLLRRICYIRTPPVNSAALLWWAAHILGLRGSSATSRDLLHKSWMSCFCLWTHTVHNYCYKAKFGRLLLRSRHIQTQWPRSTELDSFPFVVAHFHNHLLL